MGYLGRVGSSDHAGRTRRDRCDRSTPHSRHASRSPMDGPPGAMSLSGSRQAPMPTSTLDHLAGPPTPDAVRWYADPTGRVRECGPAHLIPARPFERWARASGVIALGRIDRARARGTVEPLVALEGERLERVLDQLDARHPGTRWLVQAAASEHARTRIVSSR